MTSSRKKEKDKQLIALKDYDFEAFSIVYNVLSIPYGIFKLYIKIFKCFVLRFLEGVFT